MPSAPEPVPGTVTGLAAGGRAWPVRRAGRVSRVQRRSERSLINGALSGCEADLEVLFHRHWPRAYRAAFLIVHDHAAAEDIAQEAFLAAVRRLDRFDRRRRFEPWLSAIVANRAIDWLRARSARHETGQEPWPEAAATADERPASPAYSSELLAALATLAPEQRAVVVLRHVLEYTPGEIARLLELPRGTVNSRLRRGLDTLGSQLGEAKGR